MCKTVVKGKNWTVMSMAATTSAHNPLTPRPFRGRLGFRPAAVWIAFRSSSHPVPELDLGKFSGGEHSESPIGNMIRAQIPLLVFLKRMAIQPG